MIHPQGWCILLERLGKDGAVTVLLVIYAFLCAFEQVSLYGLRADCARELYNEFKDTEYAKEAKTFIWGERAALHFSDSLLAGFVIGFITSIVTFFSVRFSFHRRSHLLGGTLFFAVYTIVLTIASLPFQYELASNLMHHAFSLLFAGIGSFSTSTYLGSDQARRKRREFAAKMRSVESLRLGLELEHNSTREHLHLTTMAFSAGIVSGAIFIFYQYFFRIPPEMRYTFSFGILLIAWFILIMTMIVGFFLGVILQIMGGMEDIIETIRNVKVKPQRKQRKKQVSKQGKS